MFDLITQSTERPLREKSVKSKVAAIVAHTAGLTALIGLTLSREVSVRPEIPTTLAFVAPPLEQLPLPPPPASTGRTSKAVSTSGQVTPADAPAEVRAEAEPIEESGGTLSGVEGGVDGGIAGGMIGAAGPVALPQPPAPPPAVPSTAPVRVGGPIKPPALVHRVEPVYSTLAAASQLSGIVVLEAVVGANGAVDNVKVLRSPGALLDIAAVDALKQWRYSPLMLNGVATPFVITVTFNFTI
jgi:periplasmic protein TonB